MKNKHYSDKVESFLIRKLSPLGLILTQSVNLDEIEENSKYHALTFSLNNKKIIYRKANVTNDRPGAFVAVWQRLISSNIENNKPIPFKDSDLDYMFIEVHEERNDTDAIESKQKLKSGIFIFPSSTLIKKGIISSAKSKGKNGFRIFPPWSEDRGTSGTKVFSESGKKTQRWQLKYFLETTSEEIDTIQFNNLFDNK